MRGYLEGNVGLRKLFAVNLEYHSPYSLPGWVEYIERYTSVSLRTIAFLDLGKIGDEDMSPLLDADILYDVGIGLRLSRSTVFGNVKLRADFPLYVNKPSLNGEESELEFRWLISFSESF